MEPSKLNKYSYIVYQFILLFAMLGILAWQYLTQMEINELILGVLLGMMIGIPVPANWPDPFVKDKSNT